jgi:2-dehydropantoate 2-reductase
MKILIMGTGGVGGFYGAKLALNKNNKVTFVVRNKSLQKTKNNGLIVKAVEGDLSIKNPNVTDKPKGEFDLILFTVKNYDLKNAAELIKPCVGNKTVILPLQNGVDAYQKLSNIFKKENVLIGVTYIITHKVDLNKIEQIGGPCQIIFGEQSGKISKRLKEIQNNFSESKINSKYTDNPLPALWSKFIFICAFAGITAITRSTIGKIRDFKPTYEIVISLIKEGISVAKKVGIKLPENYYEEAVSKIKTFNSASKSSLLIDLENNRKTEIDYLNGSMIRIAKENNLEVPVNKIVYYCIKIQDTFGS